MRIIHEGSLPELMNRPEQQPAVVKAQVQHSAACYSQQREALVFSLESFVHRMIILNEKKVLNQSSLISFN
jgi:hypothetical protein